ncbi:MAG TPA: DUF3501 family protein [Polyangiaceae bacterium]|jgi:hypothetical protein|nr:DUF3501 family protein [Polyangiaceae bacterium]
MQPIRREEVLPIGEYEALRPHFRGRVIEAKRSRRASIADDMSIVFENRDTVLLQIQEMLRTERITQESGILHEIETYNDLIPKDGELSATLFIEVSDPVKREATLVELNGLHEKISIEIDGKLERGVSAERTVEGYARTTAVQYLKFPLSEASRDALRKGGAAVAIVIDHPKRSLRAVLPPAVTKSIAEDLG